MRVDGSSATCSELREILVVDKKAIKFEVDKLDALQGKDPNNVEAKVVERIEKKIEDQVKRLERLEREKTC